MTVAQASPLPDRADASDDVAGCALRGRVVGHVGSTSPEGVGERLEVQLPGDRHDRDREPAVDRRDQRLEDLVRVHAQRRGRVQPVRGAGAARRRTRRAGRFVLADDVGDAGAAQLRDGAGAHGKSGSGRDDERPNLVDDVVHRPAVVGFQRLGERLEVGHGRRVESQRRVGRPAAIVGHDRVRSELLGRPAARERQPPALERPDDSIELRPLMVATPVNGSASIDAARDEDASTAS